MIKELKQHNSRFQRRLISARFVYDYLLSHSCIECVESEPACLDFDHLSDKSFGISNARDFSIPRIMEEINKCVIRCSNCHRRKTKDEWKDKIVYTPDNLVGSGAKVRWRRKKHQCRLRYKLFINDYFSSHPCVDCGFDDPVCLDFDHVSGVKSFQLSRGYMHAKSKVAAEIEKCVVRCSNCRRKKTAKECNWYGNYVNCVGK